MQGQKYRSFQPSFPLWNLMEFAGFPLSGMEKALILIDLFLGLRLVIPIIVKVIDRRYLQRAIHSFNKTIRIRHEEERYDEGLYLASFQLNPLGMDQYHKCIKELVRRREKLEVVLEVETEGEFEVDGLVFVTEKYKNVEDPVRYPTGPEDCCCKRFLKKGICLHMLFLREYMDLPAFDTSLFMRFRYLKNVAAYDGDLEQVPVQSERPDNEPENADIYVDDISKEKPSKPQDRYFEVQEVTKQICEIAPKYEPNQFAVVIEALKDIERLIRTNGIDEHVLKYLKNPGSYDLTPKHVGCNDHEEANTGQHQQATVDQGFHREEQDQREQDRNAEQDGAGNTHYQDIWEPLDQSELFDNSKMYDDMDHSALSFRSQYDNTYQLQNVNTGIWEDVDPNEAIIESHVGITRGRSLLPHETSLPPGPGSSPPPGPGTRLPPGPGTFPPTGPGTSGPQGPGTSHPPGPRISQPSESLTSSESQGKASQSPSSPAQVQKNTYGSAPPQTPTRSVPWPRSPFPDTPGLSSRLRSQTPLDSTVEPLYVEPHLQRVKKLVFYPTNLLQVFKTKSSNNSENNIETGAILAGSFCKDKNAWVISDIIFPKQLGTATYYTETEGNNYGTYIIQKRLTQLGTIHSHPNFESFMSCVDLHMHASIQRYENSAVAIVYSPLHDTAPFFTIKDLGLGILLSCPQTDHDRSHQHGQPDSTLYSTARHVKCDKSIALRVLDCRVENDPVQQDESRIEGDGDGGPDRVDGKLTRIKHHQF